MDFMSDRLSNGRRIRILNIIDQYTRECLATEVDTSINGVRVTRVLDRIALTRGLPEIITVDNGPEFSGRALDEWATRRDIKIDFIRPGKPIENAFIESFNGKLRNECLEMNWFLTMAEAREIIEKWRIEYNTIRPHRSLGGIPPEKFAKSCKFSDGLAHLNQVLEGAISIE
jgi:putative transposase